LHTGPIPTSGLGWMVGWVGSHAGNLWPNVDESYGVGLNKGHNYRKVSMGFWLAPSNLMDQRSTSKSFDSKYLENGGRYVGPNEHDFRSHWQQ